MKKINFKFLFLLMLVFSLFVFAFACQNNDKPDDNTPVENPDDTGKEDPVKKQVKSIEVDEESVKTAQAKDVFDYHEILINVVYDDDTTEKLNLTDDMLDDSSLSALVSFGKKKINISYGGQEVTYTITLAKGVLYSIELDMDSLKEAQAKDYFDYSEVVVKQVFTNNTTKPLSLASILSGTDVARLYCKGEIELNLRFAGKTTTAKINNEKDYFINVDDLSNVPDGKIVAVKGFVSSFNSDTIYLVGNTLGTYGECKALVAQNAKANGNLDNNFGIVAVGAKATDGDLPCVKEIVGIKSTGETLDLSTPVEFTKANDLASALSKRASFTGAKVVSRPDVLFDSKDCVIEVTDGTTNAYVVIPAATDDTLTQKIFCTVDELFKGHELVLKNFIASRYEDKPALIFIADSELSYISQADVYHRPEEGEKNAEFEAFLDDMLLWFLGDNPFNLNYQIYDLKAFDAKYGTDLYNSQVEPSNPEDMTPEKELEGYQEYLEKKTLLEAFDINTLSYSEKLAYKVIEDKLNKTLQYFKFDDEGNNVFFYYGTQLGSYLGYQAQLPAILADYRFDDKKDIEDYLEFIKVVQKDFEALYFFEKSKCEANQGSQLPDHVIDLVIEQCDNFLNATEENYLITVFNDRIGDYDFLTPEEVEAYKVKNAEYINTYFLPAYSWLKEKLIELKDLNNDSVTGGFCKTEYGVDYYQVYFQDACGNDMTVEELLQYIKDKKAYYDSTSNAFKEYDGNLMKAAGIIKATYDESLAGVITYFQEKCVNDFPALRDTYRVGENIKINTIPLALQENSSPAYYLTSPIDAQTTELIYINPPEFSEVGNYMFQTLAHEGWPGHLYQNVYFKETENNHDIRKVMGYSCYAEGWANYVENYVPKYALENYSYRKGFLASIYSSLSMCELDLGVNCYNWTVKDIIEFYGITEEDVKAGRYKWSNGETIKMSDFEDIYYRYCEIPTNYLKYYLNSSLISSNKAELK